MKLYRYTSGDIRGHLPEPVYDVFFVELAHLPGGYSNPCIADAVFRNGKVTQSTSRIYPRGADKVIVQRIRHCRWQLATDVPPEFLTHAMVLGTSNSRWLVAEVGDDFISQLERMAKTHLDAKRSITAFLNSPALRMRPEVWIILTLSILIILVWLFKLAV